MSSLRFVLCAKKNFVALFFPRCSSCLFSALELQFAFRQSNYCITRVIARAEQRDFNFFCNFVPIDKFVSSLLVRLDETLPKLVELAHWSQSSQFSTMLTHA